MSAPNGCVLSSSSGFYLLQCKKSYVRFAYARSPLSMNDTVASYIKLAKVKNAQKKKKGSAIEVNGTVKNKPAKVIFKPAGSAIDIAYFGGGKAKKGVIAKSRYFQRDVTIADIAALQKALNSRRGGITVPLNVNIPMKRFTAPDGGSSALVPDLPGWSYTGGGGVITAANATQGLAVLGVPVLVSFSSWPTRTPPISDNVTAAGGLIEAFPQYAAASSGAQVQILAAQEIPGTRGWLGAGSDSALFTVRFNLNGQPWDALFLSAAAFIPDAAFGWYWYHSYIAVPENGPGGIGPALFNTWATWDASGASQARLNQALQTLLSIRVSGAGPIDPDVFQAAANAWDDYIRGPDA